MLVMGQHAREQEHKWEPCHSSSHGKRGIKKEKGLYLQKNNWPTSSSHPYKKQGNVRNKDRAKP